MTAIASSRPAAGSLPWRVARSAAGAAVAASAAAFLAGLVLWARDDDLVAVRAALPATWSEADVRRVVAEAGLPIRAVSTYLMLLETLVAIVGLGAACLLLRGARSWFRLHLAVALALWVTLGGTLAVVYEAALPGAAGEVARALQGVAWMAVFTAAYLFPDGRFVPPWTRWALAAWPAYLLLLVGLAVLGRESDAESLVETLPLVVLFGTVLYAAAHRYRRHSSPEQRLQTRGVVAALAVWFAVVLISIATPLRTLKTEETGSGLVANGLLQLGGYLAIALLPAAITVAVLRYRLYEVDVWVDRALVYAALTAAVTLSYAGLAALGSVVWPEDALAGPLAATIVIAVLLHPMRLRAQRWVDRHVYGRRRERYAVLTDLGRRLESVAPPDQVLRTFVEAVAVTLRLPYVAATHGSLRVVHPDGAEQPAGHRHDFPIRWQDEDLGTLTVVARPGDDLGAADRDLLDGLSRQAAAAVRAATLDHALRRSRQRILVAREDERRRLQRDLHDGLGPTLASLHQRVDAARSLVGTDPAAAERLLVDVVDQTKVVITDIRGLVRDLRPPELDQLGLAGAISAAAARFDGLEVTVDAGLPPDLPPVVETAAYRIAVEALTNTARHSGARSARVRLHLHDGVLLLRVCDDGRGVTSSDPPGSGLRSMRERADELGGTVEVSRGPAGGTEVRAHLPLAVAS